MCAIHTLFDIFFHKILFSLKYLYICSLILKFNTMKKLLFLAIISLLWSCKATDEPTVKKEFKISATDMISIRPAAGTKMKVKAENSTHLSALDIVKQTDIISLGTYGGRSFINDQRDTVSSTPKLLMWATDVISLEGNLQTTFVEAKDVIFARYTLPNWQGLDTIAYIPNATLRTAEIAIKSAYVAKDIDACYKLFNEAYTFTPITGAEWRALKANGQN